jgi:TPR repeat protein
MEQFDTEECDLEQSFPLFERAAAKGHEESIWILSVVTGVARDDRKALEEAFAKTEEPLGWFFAGFLAPFRSKEEFSFCEKSALGGCSWGQAAYAVYFKYGYGVRRDKTVYVEWLEKAASQGNPQAMCKLGDWFRGKGADKEKAVRLARGAAEVGWGSSVGALARMLQEGEGCAKDLRQAAIWSAKGKSKLFFYLLEVAKRVYERGMTEDLDYDLDQFCYSLGWGLYWYMSGAQLWNQIRIGSEEGKVFGDKCLDFYCSCVELQQKSIFTFLLCWNRTTGGIKGPGQMIAQMVWKGREDNLVKTFEENGWGCVLC